MKIKTLINDLSQNSGVPAGQVRKVTKALTQRLKELIEQEEDQGGFRSGDLMFKVVSIDAKPATDEGKDATPARKFVRVILRPRKPKADRKASDKVS